ncbi:NADH-quinone oxidoreductase subunit C [Sphingobacterium yanglingense]|uniref:NADH-quinone oxidoreductase subunit C n=1 Tax=Sphingobacterium yanglingense TaxID=1437280 RepID=A0A4R6WE31_9SPHI|nr:NADH-quinone oxidoreductase subunit C [Sphingobacterium yanglingense]TDQ73370.1 NADH dehydrogenase subunit C [Sphingobacterium yanglingense]
MNKLDNQVIIDRLQAVLGDKIQVLGEPHGLLAIQTEAAYILELLAFVKNDELLRLNYLTDITAVHYPQQEKQYAVVYHLHNLFQNIRVRVKVFIGGEQPSIPSATSVWQGANWMERETYDFFGIHFEGHPDLRRILNMDDLDVFPMRKEYPLEDPNRIDKKDFYFGR